MASSFEKSSAETAFTWKRRHVVASRELSLEEVRHVLTTAQHFSEILSRPVKKVPSLRGHVVATMFFENSTRTRVSFELAAKYLSADTVSLGSSGTSVQKGETLLDTAETLKAMGVDAVVVRHASAGVSAQLAHHFGNRLAVLNAGDGCHDHPTQGLLDLYSLQERLGDLTGKKVVIVGDIAHSRVARSNIALLGLMGAIVHVVGPATLIPPDIHQLGQLTPLQVHTHLSQALPEADIVMCLRLQTERQTRGLIPSLAEYSHRYGITLARLQQYCAPNVTIMHPGPMNRGVEIASDVADNPQLSIITNQVTSGVAIRMALLYLTLNATTEVP